MKQLQFVAKIFISTRAGEFGSLKFTGREIDVGEANRRAGSVLGDGSEEIIFARIEYRDIGGGAGRDDAHDFAADNFFAWAGLLHLAILNPARMSLAT